MGKIKTILDIQHNIKADMHTFFGEASPTSLK